jgi:tetratricopeptide (TPR) repeat protein
MKIGAGLLLLASSICGAATDAVSWDEFGMQLEAGDYAAADATANAYLQDDPEHPTGLLMLLTVRQNQQRGKLQPDLAARFEACIKKHPQAAQCPLGLGEIYGMQAGQGGMLKAMGLAGDIRDQFKRAVELDPHSLRARSALYSFYSAAPAIAGGGADKAQALIDDYAKLQPEQARLLGIGTLLKNKQMAAASDLLLKAPSDTSFDTRSFHLRALINLGFRLIGDEQLQSAKELLQFAAGRYPKSPYPPLGLGRILLQEGKPQQAISLLESALQLDPLCGANYRLALAYEALGRTDDAINQFERFLKLQTAARNKDLTKDSQRRLKALRNKQAG